MTTLSGRTDLLQVVYLVRHASDVSPIDVMAHDSDDELSGTVPQLRVDTAVCVPATSTNLEEHELSAFTATVAHETTL